MPAKSHLALPALLASEGGAVCPVTISELSELRCALAEHLPPANDGLSVQLWVGAIGPLRARRSAEAPNELEFDGPLNPAIVQHFCS